MQINATLVKGKARVQFGANKVTGVTGLTNRLFLVRALKKANIETCKLVKTLIRNKTFSFVKINNVIPLF